MDRKFEEQMLREARELFGPGAELDSPNGKRAQIRLLLAQGYQTGRIVRYTFWSVVLLTVAVVADIASRFACGCGG